MQTTTRSDPNVDLAVRYHDAVGAFATGEALAEFLTPDMLHHELPNLLFPDGATRDLAAVVASSVRGREVLSAQTYEILNIVSGGDKVAVEVLWTGTLAVPHGELPAGHVMRAHIGAFLDFRDGKICGQRNYDCYERLQA